jgi:uncharacterized protein with PIN domain
MGYRQSSFLRHNVAIIAHLRHLHIDSGDSVAGRDKNKDGVCAHDLVVATPHLYWNPLFPEVKEAQATYLLDRIGAFRARILQSYRSMSGEGEGSRRAGEGGREGGDDIPVILGGDFNSLPDSQVYRLLTTPFRWKHPGLGSEMRRIRGEGDWSRPQSCIRDKDRYAPSRRPYSTTSSSSSFPQVKFLCDSSLSKFCRWLRVLGISCAMYAPPPNSHSDPNAPPGQQRLKQQQQPYDFDHLFSEARRQERVLLTTARKVIDRAACPESFFVSTGSLEASLIGLFRLYDISLDVSRFLTVCG